MKGVFMSYLCRSFYLIFLHRRPEYSTYLWREQTKAKSVIELLLLNLHWGMKISLYVRRVYWSSLNNPMCCVWDYGITSNWIFMWVMWTAGLPMLHGMQTESIMVHERHAPGCHVMRDFSCTFQCSCYQQIGSTSIKSVQISDSDILRKQILK